MNIYNQEIRVCENHRQAMNNTSVIRKSAWQTRMLLATLSQVSWLPLKQLSSWVHYFITFNPFQDNPERSKLFRRIIAMSVGAISHPFGLDRCVTDDENHPWSASGIQRVNMETGMLHQYASLPHNVTTSSRCQGQWKWFWQGSQRDGFFN